MTWIKLTAHWIVNDCDFGKVNVYALSGDCVGLYMHMVRCVCAWNFGTKFFYGRENVKHQENFIS